MATDAQNLIPIDITQKLHVYPKFRRPDNDHENVLGLSHLDRQCPLLMYLVFFYKSDDVAREFSGKSSVFSDLRTGLEETLSVWYPAAGRLCLEPPEADGAGGGKLNLWCNNGGAVMVEAVTRVKISELGDLSQYHEFSESLVYKPSFNDDFSQMPLVVAQVTRFACGGCSIGIGTSHSLFDGISAYDFLCAWASNSGKINNHNLNHDNLNKDYNLIINPVHERGKLLFTPNPNQNEQGTRAAAIDHLYELIKQEMTEQMMVSGNVNMNGGQNGNSEIPSSGFVMKTFELSGEGIEGMKKKLRDGDENLPKGFACSSFEFLAAHLWKARTRALGLRKEAMVCLQFAVDIRKRTSPPLPEGFSGNAYVLASVASTAGELLDHQTLQSIIHKIREAKNSIDQDYIHAYIGALGQQQQQQKQNDNDLPPIKGLTLVSDWARMPFHKVGFINGGQPAAYVSPLCPPVPQVAYFMLNPNDSKGVHVRIGLHPENIVDFSNYFLNY